MRVMPFDQQQRYDVVGTLAGLIQMDRPAVALDVGGFFSSAVHGSTLPIRDVLPRGWRSITVDQQSATDRSKQGATPAPFPGYAIADAGCLPFADGTFDLVSCLDVLEHVPPARRKLVIDEMLRVCRGYIAIAVPFADDGAPGKEQMLSRFIRSALGTDHPYLEEHRQLGLPSSDQIRMALPADTRSFGFGNLDRWFGMMLAKHYLLALPHAEDPSASLDSAYLALGREADRYGPFYRQYYLTTARDGVSTVPIDRTTDQFREVSSRGGESSEIFLSWLFCRLMDADRERFAEANARVLQELNRVTALLRRVEGSRLYRFHQMVRAALLGSRPS